MSATPLYTFNTQQWWLADGTDEVWNFNFAGGYIDRSHIKAWYRTAPEAAPIAIPLTDSMFVGPNQIRIVPPIAAGHVLAIYRSTPRVLPLVDFQEAGNLSEVSLDTNAKQAVFLAAETQDALAVATLDSSGLTAEVIAAAASAAAVPLINALRGELAANTGATMIGTANGDTVQERLDALATQVTEQNSDELFIKQNFSTVSENVTINPSKNGMSAGPITIPAGVTVTVPTTSVWTVL